MTQDEKTIIRKSRIKHIRSWVSACKLTPNVPELLSRFDAVNFSDLTDLQVEHLYGFMEQAHRAMTTESSLEVRRLRSKVLTLMDKLGIGRGNDWQARNAYLLQGKISGKLLYMMSSEELQALERKLYGIIHKEKAKPIERPTPVVTALLRATPPS